MKRFIKNFAIYLVIFAVVLGVAFFYKGADGAKKTAEVKFSTFATHLEKGKYKTINITDRKMTATLKNGNKEYAYAPSVVEISWLENSYVFPQVKSGKLKLSSDPPQSSVNFFSLLPTIIMVVALGFLFYFMMSQGGNNKAFQFGKNRAKLYKENGKNIRFADVAGLKEEKEELEEIVDFLKNPSKYSNLGARIPKGVLLVGNPGTGKTYISRATAGEAGVPFFTISGSDFVEMFVGVGASRVRDLFDQAKKNAPCIIFIDEIDAVGRKRGAGLGGGNDEREQTLNQLLVEMDGFDGNSGIIILAATNRPDVLDPALLRPGRFDRQIVIGMPDVKAREEIFKVHTKNKPLADDVTIEILARRTPGFSPADIENLVNEAALLTARRNGTKIRMDEIEEATTKVMAGPAKKSRVISEAERKLTAYHEAGHAIVMKAIPNSDPVHQITIIPRGMAGGFTMSLPEDEKFFMTKGDMVNMIKHLLGGRVAEELKLDDISTGASNDLERATAIARQMITKYGFSSKLGPVSFSSSDEVFLGKDFSTRQNYSEETASEIDAEIKHILESCYEATTNILKDNDEAFERVAQALLLIETLDGEQFNDLYEGKITPEELAENVKARDEEIAELNKAEAKESERLEEERRQEAEERLKELQSVIVGDLKFEDSTFAEENKHADKKDLEKPSEEEKAKSSVGWPSDTKEEPQDDEIDVDADTDADAAKDAEPESKDESKNDAEADKE
ncbi:ATP-dependent zinc metalloprotease FtsH [Mogibacterium diversum]|uniref:ATP-dependent zinc metalloprotease FtsH n=2 Tax=Mogibacterium diversum TaxID=114527 RepID=A0A2S0L2Q3_9FIRM|nr:ATP-dependent zinc metalloprotease FtsH [Mogibacterium diversum]AVM47537.1 zinc metalloprotease [Mogibacterium diversum]MBF1338396.1 ATP-dependent metallopeptidase FtsH/Yme1/Tma family protein [Mogibacterium diversum]MBF1354917.1 ATP-dependent metallopeptidase FtsH/Yme1/Tma family protein [Mogibacterium diversum]